MTFEASRSIVRLAAVALLLAALAPQPAPAQEEVAAEEQQAGAVKGTVAVGKGGEPTVVFLRDVTGDYAARVRTAEIRGGALAPKVVTAAVGDTVKFVNQDGQAHTVSSPDGGYDLGLLDRGEARGQTFLKTGAFAQRCAIHKELLGWVFVGPSPHATLADKGGAYEIRDVPAGKWSVGAWTAGAAKVSDGGNAVVDMAAATTAAAVAKPAAAKPAAPKEKPRPAETTGTIRGVVKAEPARFLEETVVYLKQVPGPYTKRTTAMDQRKMKFIPHVLTITQGDTVRFLNNDGIAHNVFTNDGEGYNLGMWKDGEERPYTFKNTGSYAQLCNIHPEMLAYVFVGQNPYSAVVDAGGRYELRNVPPGQYTLAVWNSHLNAADRSVTVERGGTSEVGFQLKR
jgi:plastocyanin